MSINVQYVVVCDGVKGPYGHKYCPQNARTLGFPTKEAAKRAFIVSYGGSKQLYPDIFVCPSCWEEYKRWTEPSDLRR